MHEDIKRTKRVTVRFTDDEYERLVAMARDKIEDESKTISRLIRENIFFENNAKEIRKMALDIRRLRIELTNAIKRYDATRSDASKDELLSVMWELDKKLSECEKEIRDGNDDP